MNVWISSPETNLVSVISDAGKVGELYADHMLKRGVRRVKCRHIGVARERFADERNSLVHTTAHPEGEDALGCEHCSAGSQLLGSTKRFERLVDEVQVVIGQLYLLDQNGTMVIVQTGPAHQKAYQEIARPKLHDTFVASPVFVGGRIYLRGAKHLYAIGTQ